MGAVWAVIATTAASTVSACDVRAEFDASTWAIVAVWVLDMKDIKRAMKSMILGYMFMCRITVSAKRGRLCRA